MMEIQSSLLGKQQINPDSIIHFPRGIPGFEDQKRFKLFHQEGKTALFWLQSIDDPDLTFAVTTPATFNINYDFSLTDEETTLLKLNDQSEITLLVLLHTDDDNRNDDKPTIKGSIRAPLIINADERLGLQKVFTSLEQSITLTEGENSEINMSEKTIESIRQPEPE
jgi:flagellar assembly factor FliW